MTRNPMRRSRSARKASSLISGPDWGWRIVFDAIDLDEFKILMCNITPQGAETLAVETNHTRRMGQPPP